MLLSTPRILSLLGMLLVCVATATVSMREEVETFSALEAFRDVAAALSQQAAATPAVGRDESSSLGDHDQFSAMKRNSTPVKVNNPWMKKAVLDEAQQEHLKRNTSSSADGKSNSDSKVKQKPSYNPNKPWIKRGDIDGQQMRVTRSIVGTPLMVRGEVIPERDLRPEGGVIGQKEKKKRTRDLRRELKGNGGAGGNRRRYYGRYGI